MKIGDFGASRTLNQASLEASSHAARLKNQLTPNRCTPCYSAPELQTTEYEVSADMWAAGAILGELLLGTMLFKSTGATGGVLMKVCHRIGWPTAQESNMLAGGLAKVLPAKPAKARSYS